MSTKAERSQAPRLMSSGVAVVAVGGNALIRDSAHTALNDQYDAVCATATHVIDMVPLAGMSS